MNASTLGVATTVTPIRYPEVELAFAWDYGLIAVSYLVAVAAAYSTVTLLQLRLHPAMVVLAAFNLSVSGIWSMHFIGMEALHLGVPMTFDPALTSLSAVFALLCTAAGFALVHWRVATARHGQQRVIDVSVAAHIRALKNAPHGTLLASGLLIAAGVCVMHYTGMVAMRTAASEEDGGRVEALAGVIAASVVIAVAAATAALYLAFVLPVSRRFVLPTALVAGVAVCGMHYTGIYGFRYFVRADVLARVGTMSRDAPWTPYVVCGSLLTSLATLAYTAYSYQTIINEAVERFALYVPPQVVDCVFAAATADDQQDRCDASASDPGEFGRSIAGTMTPPSLSTTNDGVARVVPERYRAAAALQHASVDIVRATQAMNSQSLDKTVGSGVRRPSTLREDAELAETLGTALEPLWFTPRDRSFDPFHLPTDDALTSAYRAINWLDLKMRPAVGTVAFIDVVDFTTHAERMSERELMREMTAFNGRCTDAIDRSGGVVDKYLGDAIMAVWNTVRPIGDHAARAVAAVHACVANTDVCAQLTPRNHSVYTIKSSTSSKDRDDRNTEALLFEARGGVQTGPLLMGNVGAAAKRNFTVLGDTVNQAARIEGLTRHYGVRCMIGQGTREALGPAACGFVTRFLDEAVLKGKEKTVLLHEVMADAAGPQVDEAAVRRAELVAAAYEALHERFRAGDYASVLSFTERLNCDIATEPGSITSPRFRGSGFGVPPECAGSDDAGDEHEADANGDGDTDALVPQSKPHKPNAEGHMMTESLREESLKRFASDPNQRQDTAMPGALSISAEKLALSSDRATPVAAAAPAADDDAEAPATLQAPETSRPRSQEGGGRQVGFDMPMAVSCRSEVSEMDRSGTPTAAAKEGKRQSVASDFWDIVLKSTTDAPAAVGRENLLKVLGGAVRMAALCGFVELGGSRPVHESMSERKVLGRLLAKDKPSALLRERSEEFALRRYATASMSRLANSRRRTTSSASPGDAAREAAVVRFTSK